MGGANAGHRCTGRRGAAALRWPGERARLSSCSHSAGITDSLSPLRAGEPRSSFGGAAGTGASTKSRSLLLRFRPARRSNLKHNRPTSPLMGSRYDGARFVSGSAHGDPYQRGSDRSRPSRRQPAPRSQSPYSDHGSDTGETVSAYEPMTERSTSDGRSARTGARGRYSSSGYQTQEYYQEPPTSYAYSYSRRAPSPPPDPPFRGQVQSSPDFAARLPPQPAYRTPYAPPAPAPCESIVN